MPPRSGNPFSKDRLEAAGFGVMPSTFRGGGPSQGGAAAAYLGQGASEYLKSSSGKKRPGTGHAPQPKAQRKAPAAPRKPAAPKMKKAPSAADDLAVEAARANSLALTEDGAAPALEAAPAEAPARVRSSRTGALMQLDLRQPGVVAFLHDIAGEHGRWAGGAPVAASDFRVKLTERDDEALTFGAKAMAPGRFACAGVPLSMVAAIELASSPAASRLMQKLKMDAQCSLAAGADAPAAAGAAGSSGGFCGKVLAPELVGDAASEAVWAEALRLNAYSEPTMYEGLGGWVFRKEMRAKSGRAGSGGAAASGKAQTGDMYIWAPDMRTTHDAGGSWKGWSGAGDAPIVPPKPAAAAVDAASTGAAAEAAAVPQSAADRWLASTAGGPAEWRTEGHAWIGARVTQRFKGYGFGDGTVRRWLAAGADDEPALFGIVYDDGDDEELEEHLTAACVDRHKKNAGMAAVGTTPRGQAIRSFKQLHAALVGRLALRRQEEGARAAAPPAEAVFVCAALDDEA